MPYDVDYYPAFVIQNGVDNAIITGAQFE